MNKTGIEWTDHTWNPTTGCTKVSQGCHFCYAERIWPKVSAAEASRSGQPARAFTDVRCHPDRLDQPLRITAPSRIFVNSMSDLFHEDVPDDFILQVFDVMRQCANGWTGRIGGRHGKLITTHTFQILTKRAARMLDFCSRLRFSQNDERGIYLAAALPHNGFNPMTAMRNVWLGVSCEDQATANERIPLLLQTPAAVRFISAEPLLGPIDLTSIQRTQAAGYMRPLDGRFRKLDWVIAGGESGPRARPANPDWIRALRDQCAAASVPFLFKQWGEWVTEEQSRQDALLPGTSMVAWAEKDRDGQYTRGDQTAVYRVGKKAAGRELDGRTHDEFPA